MCLSYLKPIPKKYDEPLKIHTGYKALKADLYDSNCVWFPFFGLDHLRRLSPVPLGEWLHADDEWELKITAWGPPTTYSSGFHIFPNRKAALAYAKTCALSKIAKVQYRNVSAAGVQKIRKLRKGRPSAAYYYSPLTVHVAKEMKVLKVSDV
jgi:hypothetical protein